MPDVFPEYQQDSLKVKPLISPDTTGGKSDTSLTVITGPLNDSGRVKIIRKNIRPAAINTDTTSVCRRCSVCDITFYDPANPVTQIVAPYTDRFPFLFIEKNRALSKEAREMTVRHLRPGNELQLAPLHEDWIIIVLLITVSLFAIIRKSATNLMHGIERYFLFRGINDPASRDSLGIFTWESTIKNLLSFLVLGMFIYSAATYYDLIPAPISGVIFWLISVAFVIAAVTVRHISCLITGSVSGERELFSEYIVSIYQFYRFSAIVIFVLTIIMIYTTVVPVRTCLIAGLATMGALYVLRILHLTLIFINKGVSLFYLILYLCVLEILPVVISVKYISGFI
jgi:hypothetical protein